MSRMDDLAALDWASFVASWQLTVWWDLFALLALVLYGAGLLACRRAGVPAVHPVRVACFVAGIALLVLAVSSAVGVYAMAVFWVHMVQHLLLIMVVPALLVLGHPISLGRAAAATRGCEARVDAVLRSAPVALLTHPLAGLALYSVVIVATHLTSFMDAMVTHPWLMPAEQVLYLVSGYLFLLPLLGYEPTRWEVPPLARLGLVLVGMTPDTVVGIVLLQTGGVLFPRMFGTHPGWAPSAVDDQQIGGALMWVAGDGIMMLFGVGLTVALISRAGSSQPLGSRLENVRRRTLADQVSRGEASGAQDATDWDRDVDVDEDEAMLAAYNRMLARLGGHAPPEDDDPGQR